MYVLVVAISGGDVVATSVVAKSAPSLKIWLNFAKNTNHIRMEKYGNHILDLRRSC